jgi:ABC-type multidrug transport system permease subunit
VVENNSDLLFYGIVIILAVIITISLLFGLASYFTKFSRELQMINGEIRRSTDKERRYWKKQRRKLWLSLIPFVKY